METFYIINQIPKINRAHWNLPWMSCILKFRSLKISLETLERSFHRVEKTEISREASWDIWNSTLLRALCYSHSHDVNFLAFHWFLKFPGRFLFSSSYFIFSINTFVLQFPFSPSVLLVQLSHKHFRQYYSKFSDDPSPYYSLWNNYLPENCTFFRLMFPVSKKKAITHVTKQGKR